jgi:hypothetical protein
MELPLEAANKSEIQYLKSVGILGKRAPSCSLLYAKDLLRLLYCFDKRKYAEELKRALGDETNFSTEDDPSLLIPRIQMRGQRFAPAPVALVAFPKAPLVAEDFPLRTGAPAISKDMARAMARSLRAGGAMPKRLAEAHAEQLQREAAAAAAAALLPRPVEPAPVSKRAGGGKRKAKEVSDSSAGMDALLSVLGNAKRAPARRIPLSSSASLPGDHELEDMDEEDEEGQQQQEQDDAAGEYGEEGEYDAYGEAQDERKAGGSYNKRAKLDHHPHHAAVPALAAAAAAAAAFKQSPLHALPAAVVAAAEFAVPAMPRPRGLPIQQQPLQQQQQPMHASLSALVLPMSPSPSSLSRSLAASPSASGALPGVQLRHPLLSPLLTGGMSSPLAATAGGSGGAHSARSSPSPPATPVDLIASLRAHLGASPQAAAEARRMASLFASKAREEAAAAAATAALAAGALAVASAAVTPAVKGVVGAAPELSPVGVMNLSRSSSQQRQSTSAADSDSSASASPAPPSGGGRSIIQTQPALPQSHHAHLRDISISSNGSGGLVGSMGSGSYLAAVPATPFSALLESSIAGAGAADLLMTATPASATAAAHGARGNGTADTPGGAFTFDATDMMAMQDGVF